MKEKLHNKFVLRLWETENNKQVKLDIKECDNHGIWLL